MWRLMCGGGNVAGYKSSMNWREVHATLVFGKGNNACAVSLKIINEFAILLVSILTEQTLQPLDNLEAVVFVLRYGTLLKIIG